MNLNKQVIVVQRDVKNDIIDEKRTKNELKRKGRNCLDLTWVHVKRFRG